MPSGAGVRKFLLQEDARTFPWFPQVTFSVGLDKGLRTDPILNYLVENASVCVGVSGLQVIGSKRISFATEPIQHKVTNSGKL
jgi:hypothetical protein